jgi:hypothetical protein
MAAADSYVALTVKKRDGPASQSAHWEHEVSEKKGDRRFYKRSSHNKETNERHSETGLSRDSGDWNVRTYDGDTPAESSAAFKEKTPKKIFQGFDVDVSKFGGNCHACGAGEHDPSVHKLGGGRRPRKSKKKSPKKSPKKASKKRSKKASKKRSKKRA